MNLQSSKSQSYALGGYMYPCSVHRAVFSPGKETNICSRFERARAHALSFSLLLCVRLFLCYIQNLV